MVIQYHRLRRVRSVLLGAVQLVTNRRCVRQRPYNLDVLLRDLDHTIIGFCKIGHMMRSVQFLS